MRRLTCRRPSPQHFVIGLAIALSAVTAASAEPLGKHAYLVPLGGYTIFDSDSVSGGIARGLENQAYAGVRAGYHFSRWSALELAGGYSPSRETAGLGRDVRFLQASADLLLSPVGGGMVRPFAVLGGGASRKTVGATDINHINADIGGGVDVWFTDALGLRLEARDAVRSSRDEITQTRTKTMVIGAGLNFAFGGTPRDGDRDGVADRTDVCGDTPFGARVDAHGCPLDGDGDAVVDGLDRCDGTPKGAAVNAHGCPADQDADGAFDGLDQCADTPAGARVDVHGCASDGDGDGVLDGIDQCEGTLKGASVDDHGCPTDQDRDGIPDGIDQCSDTGAGLQVDALGCPIAILERETELMDTGMIRLDNVNFATGRWDIMPESLPVLGVVGQVMERWPDLRVEIGGHTDSRGASDFNATLSQRRAEAILEHLMQRFPRLQLDQFTARGYGEAMPAAPNTTAEGMARNRRVEFVVLNKDVLKREVARRRMLTRDTGK